MKPQPMKTQNTGQNMSQSMGQNQNQGNNQFGKNLAQGFFGNQF